MAEGTMTAEESHLLTAAIVEAMIRGDRKAADYLADLAKTPEKVREILGADAPVKESLIHENFTGIDSHGHKWVNGKQVKRDKDTAGGQQGTREPAAPPSAPTAAPVTPAAKKKYGKSKAAVSLVAGNKPGEVEKVLKKMFGKKAPALADMASAVGAPDDATVSVGYDKNEDGKDIVTIKVWHPEFTAERHIFKNGSGVHVKNDEFWVNKSAQGAGIGSEVFGRQVEQCQEMGIASIRCHAAKQNPVDPGKPHNGYYTWPRFGYDAEIDYGGNFSPDFQETLHEQFPGAETLLDVMATSEGRDWWKANGVDVYHMVFDLDPKGRSMRVWDDYQQERSKKKGGA